jgi:hypothetical protein
MTSEGHMALLASMKELSCQIVANNKFDGAAMLIIISQVGHAGQKISF